MILASIESLLGSIWAAALCGVCGYVVGHVFPIGKLAALLAKKPK